jgi:hypothetical protein
MVGPWKAPVVLSFIIVDVSTLYKRGVEEPGGKALIPQSPREDERLAPFLDF